MIPYSLHVAIILAVCLFFYKLLLQRETYYGLNRTVLLVCLGLAFVLPLIPVSQQFSFRLNPQVINADNFPADNTQPVFTAEKVRPLAKLHDFKIPVNQPVQKISFIQLLTKWIFWLYWCGVAVFALNLLLQVLVLLGQSRKKTVIRDGMFLIVELDDDKAPCSFGNRIFINPAKYDWDTYNQILMHEKVHIQQGHSIDLMLAELVLIFQWFNPFAWLYRKELENNLEFLTDDAVLNQHQVEKTDYQLSLLKVSVPNMSMNITTNYNQSLLKKRIVMMNAKKSNIHTMWKYFMLLPVLFVLVCGLNKPLAISGPIVKVNKPVMKENIAAFFTEDESEGLWFATIKGDKVQIEFKGEKDDHTWSSSDSFNLSDFPSLPKEQKADFSLKREAGSVLFNGKFDGDQGYGHYKFTPDKGYVAFMEKQGIPMEQHDYFTFFMINIKKEYVQFVKENGFNDVTKNQLISMSALKVDAGYIRYWRKIGYTELSPNELVSLKALKVDSTYVNEIRKAGYTNLSVHELISFKAQHITGSYINGLKRVEVKAPGDKALNGNPSPQEIMSSRAMNIDSDYVRGMRSVGYTNVPYHELGAMKSMHITPEYIKSFEAVGFKNIPLHSLFAMKAQGITPEYIKGFQDIGYRDLTTSQLTSLKAQSISPAFIKGYQDIGYAEVPVSALWMLSAQHITPEYIKSFQDIGYKNPPLFQFASLKSQGITPEFVKGFNKLGFTDIPLTELPMLKSTGITPEYVADMKQKGFNSKDLHRYMQLKSFN